MKTLVLLMVTSCVQWIHAYPNGPTNLACADMEPRHGVGPQTSEAPYTITLSKDTYQKDQEVTVTVSATAPTETPFKGFFVQARRNDSTDAIGQFMTGNDDEIGTITCPGGMNNAINHKDKSNKTSKSFKWKNAEGGDVYFQGTFVNVQTNFWMNVRSAPLSEVEGGGGSTGSSTSPQPEVVSLAFFLCVMRILAILS